MVTECTWCEGTKGIPDEGLKICDPCANQLIQGRNKYKYPSAHLIIEDEHLVAMHANKDRFKSSIDLDFYHFRLLNSEDPSEVVIGLKSTLYWGFYIFNHEYAFNRVGWLGYGRKGNGGINKLGFDYVVTIIRAAIKHITNDQIDKLIMEISKLPEFGQIAFASKVCAFLDPQKCGIYDKRIHNVFNMMAPNNGGVTKPKAIKYMIYCKNLQEVARDLNKGIAINKNWYWTDWDGSKHKWRAIDIERAYFRQSN